MLEHSGKESVPHTYSLSPNFPLTSVRLSTLHCIEKMAEYKEMLHVDVVGNSVSENCRCNELEERFKKADARCAELELGLQKKNKQCEALEAKLDTLEVEKFAVEEELKVLRVSSEGLKGRKEVGNEKARGIEAIVDLTDDNEVVQLMIENKVLECEKKRAESEVEFWKDKYKKMESWALQLGLGKGSYCHEENDGNKEDSNRIGAKGSSHLGPIFESKEQPVRQVKKQLAFEIEESPSKKMAPSTPISAKSASVSVIDIIDSDDEPNITQPPVLDCQGNRSVSVSPCFVAENGKLSDSNAQNNEEEFGFGEDVPFVATQKRKRTCNIVTSESEHDDDDDDNMPICKLKKLRFQEASPDQVRRETNSFVAAATSADDKVASTATPRRRLVPLRKCAKKIKEGKKPSGRSNKAKHQQSTPTDAGADESEEDSSDCEDEGLSDFIVDDSDVSNCDDASSNSLDVSNGDEDSDSGNSQDVPEKDMSSDSQDESDGDVDFGKILSQIQRRKDHKMEWEFEADMLAAFGKDPELCLKAVCALYRQQTSEEQVSRGTLHSNKRGFSKIDAHRGSTVAEFLTHGDPHGGLTKTVKELQEYDPKAVEMCRTLATRYSKQLYEIYKNKEDPLFP